MSCISDNALGILALVEGCIVHDDNSFELEAWGQILRHPCGKNVSIYIHIEQSHGEQCFTDQSANNVGPPFGVPRGA